MGNKDDFEEKKDEWVDDDPEPVEDDGEEESKELDDTDGETDYEEFMKNDWSTMEYVVYISLILVGASILLLSVSVYSLFVDTVDSTPPQPYKELTPTLECWTYKQQDCNQIIYEENTGMAYRKGILMDSTNCTCLEYILKYYPKEEQ